VSATSGGEVSPARTWGVEALGTRAVPLDSLVELGRLYFGLAMAVANEENDDFMWCSKKVAGLLFL
jgi:hypothetical protein